MKKQIEDIKQFVIDRFKPQGIEIDLDFGTNDEYIMQMYLTFREPKDRENSSWGRTLQVLRETFTYASFVSISEYVNDDDFKTERIIFVLN